MGFAWAPGRSTLWHATAARLSELLPVVLYYFFDEAGLRRCPLHQGGGPLYRSFCPACEAAARTGPQDDPDASRWIAGGRAFLDREMAAVARTRRKGVVVPHHHATLDLSSDGLAYAAGHLPRLRSATFHDYIDRFFDENEGWHTDLDALIARIEAIAEALCGGDAPAPLSGGRWRWMAQDLAWRVLLVVEQAEGEVVEALDDRVLDPLSRAGAQGSSDTESEAAIVAAIGAYREIHADWVVPEPGELFGVGYDLPGGLGRCEAQVYAGIQSALPGTCALLGDEAEELASDFTWADRAERAPIGQRFAAWLGALQPETPAADQAAF